MGLLLLRPAGGIGGAGALAITATLAATGRRASTPTLAAVLMGSHTPVARLEFLTADLSTVLASAPLVAGSVTTDRGSDTYASASVEVLDEDGSLSPEDSASLVWPDRPVRLSRGALVGGVPVYVPLMLGVIADPVDASRSGRVSFAVNSRFSLARRRFSGPTTISAGIRGREAIQQVLALGGLGSAGAWYDLQDDNYIVPVARTFDTKDEILAAAIKWAFDMNCDLWPAATGVTTMRPFADLATAAQQWDFTGTLIDSQRTVRSLQTYNRWVVYGRAPDGYPVMAQAVLQDPAHALHWRPDLDLPAPPYTSVDITTTAAAQAVADRLRFEGFTYEEAVDARALPVPLVAARAVVSLTGSTRDLLDRVTMPLYHGEMRTADAPSAAAVTGVPSERDLAAALNRVAARVGDQRVASLAEAFGRGWVATVRAGHADVRKGAPDAVPTPDWDVPPDLHLAAGDLVWYYEFGSDRLVVAALDRSVIAPHASDPSVGAFVGLLAGASAQDRAGTALAHDDTTSRVALDGAAFDTAVPTYDSAVYWRGDGTLLVPPGLGGTYSVAITLAASSADFRGATRAAIGAEVWVDGAPLEVPIAATVDLPDPDAFGARQWTVSASGLAVLAAGAVVTLQAVAYTIAPAPPPDGYPVPFTFYCTHLALQRIAPAAVHL